MPTRRRLPFSFADVVAHANDVVIVTDADTGQTVYVNRAFSLLTGYTPEEVIGHSPGKLLQGPDTDARTVARIRQALRNRIGIRTEILNYDKSGRTYWLEMNIVPLRDADGTVRHFAAIERDVTAHRTLNLQLQRQAATDELTGLANRRSFADSLKREVAHARRVREPLALIAFDLDHFKSINDLHGHGAGDAVLRAVAERCVPSLRPRDLLARSGGEEFHALLPNTTLEQAVMVAERLRVAIETSTVRSAADVITATASFGVTTMLRSEFEGESAMRRADALMYTAKRLGRNQVCHQADAATAQRGPAVTGLPEAAS